MAPESSISQIPRTSRKSWARDTGWLLGANVSKTGGLLLFLLVLARFTNAKTVGDYALALAITAPIFVFAQLGLKGIFLTHDLPIQFRTYVRLQLASIAIATLVSVGASALAIGALVPTVLLVSIIKSVDSITDLFAAPLQQYEKTARIFVGSGGSSLVAAIAATTALIMGVNLNLALITFATASVIAAAPTMWFPGIRFVRIYEAETDAQIENSSDQFKKLLRAGIPVGLSGALVALVATLPQYFLSAYFGTSAVAHFAVFFYAIALADIFLSTLSQSWIPRAREALTHPAIAPHGFFRFLIRTTLTWTFAVAPIGLAGIAAAWFVVPAVFGPDFKLSFAIAAPIWATIVAMPLAAFSNIGTIVKNLYVHTIWLSSLSAIASLVACAVLIPTSGIAGAFWSLLVASIARAVPSAALLRSVELKADTK